MKDRFISKKSAGKKFEDMDFEEQMLDASDSFVRNMIFVMFEVVLLVSSALFILHFLGLINVFSFL